MYDNQMPTKAISVRAPYWWYILYGGKDVENRGASFGHAEFRGPILLHVSSWYKGPRILGAMDECRELSYLSGASVPANTHNEHPPTLAMFKEVRGGFVGIVDVVDVRKSPSDPDSIWETPDGVGLVLANPRPIQFYAYAGALGLFNVPHDVAARATSRLTIAS